MSFELEESMLQLQDKAELCFHNFMARVAKLEELTNAGSRFLKGFRHELEYFKSPPIQNTSKIFDEAIKANNTKRMSAYVDAGHRHAYVDTENTGKLFSCHQGLLEHQKNVKLLISELEGLTEGCIGTMQQANENTSDWFVEHVEEEIHHLEFDIEDAKEVCDGFQQKMQVLEHLCEKITRLVILMRILCKMLKLDYTMQDNIVMSLNLNSTLDQIDSYSLMWELRPYVDEKIVRQCWTLIS